MKHYSTQELLAISNKAPTAVQETLSAETTIAAITSLAGDLKLHVDQIRLVAELNVQMLLGLISPEEFLSELIIAKISDADARQIMAEINQNIFVPLREQMRSGGTKVGQTVRPAVQATPQPKVSMPVPNYAPPSPPVSTSPPRPAPRVSEMPPPSVIIQANPQLPPRPAQVAASMMHYTSRPSGAFGAGGPLSKQPPPKATTPFPPRPTPPTQRQAPTVNTGTMLEDHEEPHIEFRRPQPPVSRFTPPPPNLPGTMPPRPSVASSAGGPPPVPLTPRPPIEHYSSDPYHEPIDEN